ncbi:MAG: allantoicase [Gammaproteobacteria bacterium]|nr:allantoicase [Gammaproteobacteria bacterium]
MPLTNHPVLHASLPDLPDWAKRTINLADPRFGASIRSCSDDFFAPAARMLQAPAASFIPDKYDENGKWMDGWESRRRRDGGYDWCVVKLGRPATLVGADIDTSFFTGNYPPSASLDGCPAGADPDNAAGWTTLIPQTPLRPDSHHLLPIQAAAASVYSHVRINIFPDGGIARLRIYGQIDPGSIEYAPDGLVDLVALINGGHAIAWNDAHYGTVSNLLLPGRGVDMGDGWETRRRREPGHDWCVLGLALPGTVERIEIDTAHFKGNFPHRISLQAIDLQADVSEGEIARSYQWPTLLMEQPLGPDRIHYFSSLEGLGIINHVRFNLFPDGGISRLRLWGKPGTAACAGY